MMDRYRVDWEKLKPVGRMAGTLYTLCQQVLSVKRKRYEEVEVPVEK